MNIAHKFHTASFSTCVSAGELSAADQRYLVVSARNLSADTFANAEAQGGILKIALDKQTDVDEALNTITKWMRDHDVLNQQGHCDGFGDYNLFFHFIDEGAVYPSVTHDFPLHDYVFAGNDGLNPGNFDGLMIMLDRHLLAGDMRKGLAEDIRYAIPERDDAPHFWCLYIRQCSHPDYRRQSGPSPVYS